jgi:ABC-type glycerol-3-phosphate transport system permease component
MRMKHNSSVRTQEKVSAGQVITTILVILGGLTMIYPLLWMVMSSLKENNEIFSSASSLIPKEFHFENYANGADLRRSALPHFLKIPSLSLPWEPSALSFPRHLLHLDLQD